MNVALVAALVVLSTASALAQRSLMQAQPQQPPALPALQVDDQTKSFVQSALQDVFSALAYSAGDQQKIAPPSSPKPQPGWHKHMISPLDSRILHSTEPSLHTDLCHDRRLSCYADRC